jgi:hypothetical protein
MRRAAVSAVALAATCAVVVPATAGPTGRTVHRTYTLATSTVAPTGTVYCCGVGVDGDYYGLAYAQPRTAERTVRVTIADHVLGAVAAIVEQSTAHGAVRLATVCGATTKAIPLVNHHGSVVVRPAYGVCGASASVPTTGTVTFRFSR